MTREEFFDSYQAMVNNLDLTRDSARKDRILHALIGIQTESGELMDIAKKCMYGKEVDFDNVLEEVGDVFFYTCLLFDSFGLSFYSLVSQQESNLVTTSPIDRGSSILNGRVSDDSIKMFNNIVDYSMRVTDGFMGGTVFSSTTGKKFVSVAEWLVSVTLDFCHQIGIQIDLIMDINIAKLTKRYGEKFSTESALNRDLDGEFKAMKEVFLLNEKSSEE